jgi:hypothetical protein
MQSNAELRSNDAGERGLPEARRTGEQQVIDSLLTPPCCLKDDAEVLLELTLTHELLEGPRAKSAFLADEIAAIRFER